MTKSERYIAILDILRNNREVNVGQLAERFNTSGMTIRRDLNFLSQQYNITRTHGGAFIDNAPIVRMTSFDEERIENREQKERIAKKAVEFIKNGQRIYIDAGSTTRIMLHYMSALIKNVIVTNHIKLAEQALGMENLSVIMLGGEMIRISNCSSGTITEEQIKRYQLDIAFLGACAVGVDGKLYDGYSPEARLKTSIFSVAKEVYLLADSSKFNIYDLNEFGDLTKIKAVITDSGINEEGLALLKRYRVETIIV